MLGKFPAESLAASVNTPTGRSFGYPEDWTLERVKEHHMRRVLEVCEGNRSQAARRLGVSRKTLERKLGPRGGSADMPSSDI
jgi:ActR/RegA family two-component response regulator